MKILTVMFCCLTVINLPIYFFYGGASDEEHMSSSINEMISNWSFGNLGSDEHICGYSSVIYDKNNPAPTIDLKCHQEGMYINSLEVMGFLQPYDR